VNSIALNLQASPSAVAMPEGYRPLRAYCEVRANLARRESHSAAPGG